MVRIVMRMTRPVAGIAVRRSSIIDVIPRCRVTLVPVQIANPTVNKVRAFPCSLFVVDWILLLLPKKPSVKMRIITMPMIMVSRPIIRIATGRTADLGKHRGANCGLVNRVNIPPPTALAPIKHARPYFSAGDFTVCATVQSRNAALNVRAAWSKKVDTAIVP